MFQYIGPWSLDGKVRPRGGGVLGGGGVFDSVIETRRGCLWPLTLDNGQATSKHDKYARFERFGPTANPFFDNYISAQPTDIGNHLEKRVFLTIRSEQYCVVMTFCLCVIACALASLGAPTYFLDLLATFIFSQIKACAANGKKRKAT